MSSTHNEPSELSKPRQSKAWMQLLAVVLGVLPLYSSLIILQLRSDKPFSMTCMAIVAGSAVKWTRQASSTWPTFQKTLKSI